jgi:hypothetical protein
MIRLVGQRYNLVPNLSLLSFTQARRPISLCPSFTTEQPHRRLPNLRACCIVAHSNK